MAKDYYETLGLARGASADDIKKAYRKLSKELHPDKHKGDKAAEQRFKEVNQAYEVLSNPQKKQGYDQFGEAGAQGGAGFGGGGQGFGGFDFSNFSQGDFGDIFEGIFGGGGRTQRTETERGADKEVELTINLKDVVSGVRHQFRIKKEITCDVCAGSGAEKGTKLETCKECSGTGQVVRVAQSFFGRVQQRMICPTCRGSGKIPEKPCHKCHGEGRRNDAVTVTAEVPAGIADGQTLRLRGEGDAGRRGAVAGDLFVHIRVAPDAHFIREGDDVRCSHTISAVDAILGTTLSLETLQGKVELKIPEGTQPGQVFRVKGKGLPVLQRSSVGDHYTTIEVEIPKKLSKKERQLLEEWKKLQ